MLPFARWMRPTLPAASVRTTTSHKCTTARMPAMWATCLTRSDTLVRITQELNKNYSRITQELQGPSLMPPDEALTYPYIRTLSHFHFHTNTQTHKLASARSPPCAQCTLARAKSQNYKTTKLQNHRITKSQDHIARFCIRKSGAHTMLHTHTRTRT